MPKIRRARMFGIGTDPKLRALGILPALFQAMVEGALHRFDEFEFGWISEANLQSLRAVRHILPMEPREDLPPLRGAVAAVVGHATRMSFAPRSTILVELGDLDVALALLVVAVGVVVELAVLLVPVDEVLVL